MSASRIIREKKIEIITRWTAQVREKIPKARKYDVPILKNNIPELLDALVTALASDDARKVVYKSESHGRKRAEETNYSLKNIILEYRLLKETIFLVLDEQGDKISTRERDGIMYAIDQAVEQSCDIFYQMRTEKSEQARERAETLLVDMEEQDQLRDQFIATLSHDLRGPLNNTIQLTELLAEHLGSDPDPFVSRLIDGIKVSCDRGNKLISTLLDVSLIQSGNHIPVQKEESDILQEAVASFESLKPAQKERIKIANNKGKIVGFWDSSALRRAIDNLVSNAFKYGEKEGKVRIEFYQDQKETVISVHNSGNPIPSEKLDKLFNIYYRTQDVKALGWGLGLTLVNGIAKAHDGYVEVNSNAEDGTAFFIHLPAQIKS